MKINPLKNFFFRYLERFLLQLISFTTTLIFARLIIPKDFGLIALINVILVFFNMFITSIFSNALIKFNDLGNNSIKSVFNFSLIFSFFLYSVIFFISPFIEIFFQVGNLSHLIRAYSLSLPFISMSNVLQTNFIKNSNFKLLLFSTILASLVSSFISVYFAFINFGDLQIYFPSKWRRYRHLYFRSRDGTNDYCGDYCFGS
jgi:O-antigen/teichoic acid export membrane protein